jgi:hypothetical protein
MNRTASIWLAVFPIALTLGVFAIPVVADYGNHELAAAAARLTARWYWGHLLSALAFGIAGVAAVALHSALARCAGKPPDLWAAALAVIGAAMHMYGLGADGVGPTAILAAGGEPEIYFGGLGLRLNGIFMAGAVAFSIGWLGLTAAVLRVGPVRDWRRWWIPGGVLLMAASEAIPSGWGLYVVAVMALAVWLPLSWSVRGMPAH